MATEDLKEGGHTMSGGWCCCPHIMSGGGCCCIHQGVVAHISCLEEGIVAHTHHVWRRALLPPHIMSGGEHCCPHPYLDVVHTPYLEEGVVAVAE